MTTQTITLTKDKGCSYPSKEQRNEIRRFSKIKKKFGKYKSKDITIAVTKETAIAMTIKNLQIGIMDEIKNKKMFHAELSAYAGLYAGTADIPIFFGANKKTMDSAIKIVNKYF